MSRDIGFQPCPDGCSNTFCDLCYKQDYDIKKDDCLFKIICNGCNEEMELDYVENDKNKSHYSCEECNLEIQIIATVTVELGETFEEKK